MPEDVFERRAVVLPVARGRFVLFGHKNVQKDHGLNAIGAHMPKFN
jgi:hypothetical protein